LGGISRAGPYGAWLDIVRHHAVGPDNAVAADVYASVVPDPDTVTDNDARPRRRGIESIVEVRKTRVVGGPNVHVVAYCAASANHDLGRPRMCRDVAVVS
jgi:hypothetical protein